MLEERLHALIDFAKTTDLQEILVERDGVLIAFRRAPGVTPRPSLKAANGDTVPVDELPVPEVFYIRSTMVGTFYRADSIDRPPLVVEGTMVDSGQPVASVEAMKIMKDVVAPMPCRIVKALVANGHPVEYGQPLFEVEPENV
jgi:acetyl-CoA carboxylase biotin carboxyl carrier protein